MKQEEFKRVITCPYCGRPEILVDGKAPVRISVCCTKFNKAAIAYGKLGDFKDAHEKSFALWDDVAVRETIATDGSHTVGLKSDGTVVAVGENDDGQCDVSEWADIVAVAVGNDHTVGLKSDGTVVAVGENDDGQCDVSEWADIVAISAGGHTTIGLKADGTVVACGERGVGDWSDIIAVSTGGRHTVGLKADGTVVAVGDNENEQCNVEEWVDIVAVSAGAAHTVGLKSNGTLEYCGLYTANWKGMPYDLPWHQTGCQKWCHSVIFNAKHSCRLLISE